MTHFQLVQAATDLLSEMREPWSWLSQYDVALGSSSDRELTSLVHSLRTERHSPDKVAA